jgi:hypothetical protein
MTWVKDFLDRRVNIRNYDVMEYRDIVDQETEATIAFVIYLSKGKETLTLGHVRQNEGMDGERLLEHICCGIDVYFECLQGIVYEYMRECFDEELGNLLADKDFHKGYEERMEKASKMIGKRFVEEQR